MDKYIMNLYHHIINNMDIHSIIYDMTRHYQIDYISEYIINNENHLIKPIIYNGIIRNNIYNINHIMTIYKLLCKLDVEFVVNLYYKNHINDYTINCILKMIIDNELLERKYKKDLQEMRNQIYELEEQNKELKEENNQLELQIEYMPFSEEYYKAKKHFETLSIQN